MLRAKIISTSYRKNRAGKGLLVCTAEIRRGQNITAEYIQPPGEFSQPLIGDWIVAIPKDQSFGGWFALGFVDIINIIREERGVKVIYGRDKNGTARTKITLTDSDVVIENPHSASVKLADGEIILNAGSGTALEADRLQIALDTFAASILAELNKIALLTEPKNPSNPYTPPADLPADISAAKSEAIKLP